MGDPAGWRYDPFLQPYCPSSPSTHTHRHMATQTHMVPSSLPVAPQTPPHTHNPNARIELSLRKCTHGLPIWTCRGNDAIFTAHEGNEPLVTSRARPPAAWLLRGRRLSSAASEPRTPVREPCFWNSASFSNFLWVLPEGPYDSSGI